jgi:hypothetical protein
MSDTEATRVIGAYYAFAYDHFRSACGGSR